MLVLMLNLNSGPVMGAETRTRLCVCFQVEKDPLHLNNHHCGGHHLTAGMGQWS